MRTSNALTDLIANINSDNHEVRRYVTGAIRNVIYENMENKRLFIKEGGLKELSKALEVADDDLYKNITGKIRIIQSGIIKTRTKHVGSAATDIKSFLKDVCNLT